MSVLLLISNALHCFDKPTEWGQYKCKNKFSE